LDHKELIESNIVKAFRRAVFRQAAIVLSKKCGSLLFILYTASASNGFCADSQKQRKRTNKLDLQSTGQLPSNIMEEETAFTPLSNYSKSHSLRPGRKIYCNRPLTLQANE